MKDRKITFRVTQEEYTLIDKMKKTETRFTYGGRWDLSAYIRNLVPVSYTHLTLPTN